MLYRSTLDPRGLSCSASSRGPATTRYATRVGIAYITTSGKDLALYIGTLLPAVREDAAMTGRSISD
jgi:coenzyme F420-dependent glucose-6-phosphate dehydrogenase